MNRKQRRGDKSRRPSEKDSSTDMVFEILREALTHHNARRFSEAEKLYRHALKIDPQNADTLHLLGVLANDVGQHGVAVELIGKAIAKRDDIPFFHNNLGNALDELGRTDDALNCYRRALALKPDYAEALNNLGNIFKEQNNLNDALNCYRRAIALRPDYPETHNNLGTVLKSQDKIDDAIACYRQAISLKPDYAEAYFNLGKGLREQNRLSDAVACLLNAVNIKPDFVDAYNEMGQCMHQQHIFESAIACFEKTLAIKPDSVEAFNGLGSAFLAQGKLDQAITNFRRGRFQGNALLAMVYAASVSPEKLAATAREIAGEQFDPLFQEHSFDRDKNPTRRLRIGYVSPDFRDHSVNYFFEPLLTQHDHKKFEVFGYSVARKEDHVTDRLKKEFDHWRPICSESDDHTANLILKDSIDILVDLAGHTGESRLGIFARKPAPVQVTWLGFPATTGMKAMDYRITDVYAEPEGMTEHLNVEKLWRLPTIFCCYGAPNNDIPVIDHPPFEDNGYITFGCFNNFAKVTDPVLETWARIMVQVPDSHLLLEIAGLDSPQFRGEIEERLKKIGVPIERVILEPRKRENQFVLYNKLDIALDPFPCNGGTTSFDTMWMGVPFVALAGEHFVSRMGVTILTNAGLPELIAKDKDEYVKIATALATDKDRLRRLRHDLRDRVVKSPLMDQQAFARHVEAAYREMWRKWCDEQS